MQDILSEAWDWDYGSPPDLTEDQEDRIIRAVLIDKISGMELEWRDKKRGNVVEANGLGSDFYVVDGGGWILYSFDGLRRGIGTGGKAGALADYKAKVAAELGMEWAAT